MAQRILCEGNEAVGRGAIAAGCKYFFGYPITPQNEIPEFMSRELPKIGGVYVQSECETASISMVMGGAATGERVMTSTASPGFSLMQEGLSLMAEADLPAVVVNVNRLGPGQGTGGQHGQTDYRQVTKGGGHGGYRCIVLSPWSVQEIFDHMQLGFHLADKYRMTTIVLMDFILGRMAESLEPKVLNLGPVPAKEWGLKGKGLRGGKRSQVLGGFAFGEGQVAGFFKRQIEKYKTIEQNETRCESYFCDDAKVLIVSYGSSARMAMSAVEKARERGIKAGLFRPVTLWPFPGEAIQKMALQAGKVLVVEDNQGQLVEDVECAVQGKVPVRLLNILGRNQPGPSGLIYPERILEEVIALA